MITHNQWRTSFLAATSIGILFLTVYSWFSPTMSKRQASSFSFSDKIVLNSWQLIETEPLSDRDYRKSREVTRQERAPNQDLPKNVNVLNSGKRYLYLKQGIPLSIEMRYLIGVKTGVDNFILHRTELSTEVIEQAKLQKIKGIGFYLLFSDRDKTYLSTCINPRGQTTTTLKQFLSNRFSYDLRFNHLLSWILGKKSAIDLRCMWVHMSVKSDRSNSQIAYQTLTKAWIDWYHWWQPRFPKL